MDDFRIDLFTARERRAAVLVVAALVVIGAAAFSFLRPAPSPGARAAATSAPRARPPSILAIAPESANDVYAVVGPDIGPTRDPSGRWLVRSTDAGRTWKRLALPKGAGAPITVAVVPDSGGVVVTCFDPGNGPATFRATTWRSTDHGGHWTQLTPPTRRGTPQAIDRLHWYAVDGSTGYSVAATSDEGRTWATVLDLPPAAGELAGIALPAERSALFSATGSEAFWVSITERSAAAFITPGTLPLLFRSRDGGRTWSAVPLGLPPPAAGTGWSATTPQIGPDGRGLIVLHGVRPGSSPASGFFTTSAVVTTADGGQTWSAPRAVAHLNIQLGPGDSWWTVEGASLLETRDEGATWTDVALTVPRDGTLGLLFFVDARTLWSFAFAGGRPLRSTDGGRTWREVPGPPR